MTDETPTPKRLAAQIRQRHQRVMTDLDHLARKPEQNPAWVRTVAQAVRQHCADMMVELAAMEASEAELVARLQERPSSGRQAGTTKK